MLCSVKKLLTKFLLTTLGLLFIGGAWIFSSLDSWILIESTESKTKDLSEVYNQIKFQTSATQDEWLMKQSHDGIHAKNWDELKIKIDKTKSPYEVSYYQYKDGKEAEYRASCYLCHANGPRLIRPNQQSQKAPLSLKEKVMISALNLRIKTYGPMVTVNRRDYAGSVPIRYYGQMESAPLKVKTCVLCHHSHTFWGRAEIRRQHVNTALHLVQTGQMPPWPFKLSEKEKQELDLYFRGF